MKLNKKRIVKKLKKLNFATVFFFIMSLISTTFAWFAFSNVVNNNMEINVKSWQVNINDSEGALSNKLDIKIDSFYPGSELTSKTINIKNTGDLPSTISFKINYLRIFDKEFDTTNQEELFDKISQEYPFTINFNLDSNYLDNDYDTNFTYSIIWPLDSGNDSLDTEWGTNAYNFYESEKNKYNADNSYTIRKGIELIVELVVEQYVGEDTEVPNINYTLGKKILYNPITLNNCNDGEENCYKYYIIEENNLVSSTEVLTMISPSEITTLVPYSETNENSIKLNDILNIINNDVLETNIVRNNLSNRTLGNVYDINKYTDILNLINNNNATIEFSKLKYNYLKSNECYWLYNETYNNIAIKNKDENTIMLYKEEINNCKNITTTIITKNS